MSKNKKKSSTFTFSKQSFLEIFDFWLKTPQKYKSCSKNGQNHHFALLSFTFHQKKSTFQHWPFFSDLWHGITQAEGYIWQYIPPLVLIRIQYIIIKVGILRFSLPIQAASKGYISQYTPQGVYGLIVNENNEVNVSLLIFLKLYTFCIRTQPRIYGQLYPFAFRNSLWLRLWELLQGYIWPYFPRLVLIWTQSVAVICSREMYWMA